MTRRLSTPLALLLLLTAGALSFFIYFGQWFPPVLAVHFDLAGNPNGWQDRIKFIVIGTSLSFILPPFLVACIGVLPRVIPPRSINLPNREFWLAPERREETYNAMLYFALWLACLVQAFLIAIHVTIARANPAGAPPHAPQGTLLIGLVFAASLIAWSVRFVSGFVRTE